MAGQQVHQRERAQRQLLIAGWQIDLDTGDVSKAQVQRKFTPRSAAVLRYLVERADQLVTSEELLDTFWRGGLSADNAVQKAVSEIRRLLEDDARQSRVIRTVSKQGYIFLSSCLTQTQADDSPATANTLEQPLNTRDQAVRTGLPLLAPWIAVAILLLGIVAWWRLATPDATAVSNYPLTSLAVLPFDDFSEGSENAWLADAMTEELIESLSRVEALDVKARTSAHALKQRGLDIRTIGTQLKVGAVIEGSIQRTGNQLRITVQLISTTNDSHIWSAQYNRNFEDLFATQEELGRAVVEAIRSELGIVEGFSWLQRSRYETTDVRAYELVRNAVEAEQTYTHAGFLREIELTRLALEIDPEYAQAHAQHGWGHYFLWQYRAKPETLSLAISSAQQALQIDPVNSAANNLLAEIAMNEGNWAAAEAHVVTALEAAPNVGPLRSSHALILLSTGRHEQALAEARRAVTLDNSKGFQTVLGHVHLVRGDIPQALEALERAAQQGSRRAVGSLLYAYLRLGKNQQALDLLVLMAEHSGVPGTSIQLAFSAGGIDAALKEWSDRVLQGDEVCPVSPTLMALVVEKGRVLDCLQWRVQRKIAAWDMINAHPAFRSLQGEPRYMALLKEMNLPAPAW